MKPAPYCTNQMLAGLRDLNRWGTCAFPMHVWWSLKSRGWIDWNGAITEAGRLYLKRRGHYV